MERNPDRIKEPETEQIPREKESKGGESKSKRRQHAVKDIGIQGLKGRGQMGRESESAGWGGRGGTAAATGHKVGAQHVSSQNVLGHLHLGQPFQFCSLAPQSCFFRTQDHPPSSPAQPNLARCLVGAAASWNSRPLQALGSWLDRQLPGSGQAELPLWIWHPNSTFSRCLEVGTWQGWSSVLQMWLRGLGTQGISSQQLAYPSSGSQRLEGTEAKVGPPSV